MPYAPYLGLLIGMMALHWILYYDTFQRYLAAHLNARVVDLKRAQTYQMDSGRHWRLPARYLRDAQVLVLDEPTAALDARAEVEVYRQFQDMSQGKSVLLILHRLSSARLADRIVFLERGQIAEEGSHQTLVQKGGRYADMFAVQAEWYQ